jgi:hypothetical protein
MFVQTFKNVLLDMICSFLSKLLEWKDACLHYQRKKVHTNLMHDWNGNEP